MRDERKLDSLRTTLAADGYRMRVHDSEDATVVTIDATDEACEDCLVPKNVMVSILQPALDVPAASILLRYPADRDER